MIGIDPTTGTQKFAVPLESAGGASFLGLIIAGDGYAYVPYQTDECVGPPAWEAYHLGLLRLGSDGSYQTITISDWTSGLRLNPCEIPTFSDVQMITNADQGVVLSWGPGTPDDLRMATTTGASVSFVGAPEVPGQQGPVEPVLQAQDGSFVGTAWTGDNGDVPYMVAFDATGGVRWAVEGYGPKIATADGGVIAQAYDPATQDFTGPAVTFDQSGSVTGQMDLPIQSWTGNAYQVGSVDLIVANPLYLALSFWPFQKANTSGNLAGVQVAQVRLRWFKFNGTQNIDAAGIVKEAQDTWSKQSNGTIVLLWDHSIQYVDPCALPNCETGDPADLLDINYLVQGTFWDQTNYLLQKFPNRQGINVVHNATLSNDAKGATPNTPVRPYPNFVNTPINVIVLPNDTEKNLGHEVGHVLGLPHVASPFNLMCGQSPGANDWLAGIESFWCFAYRPYSHSIDANQLKTAQANAFTLVGK